MLPKFPLQKTARNPRKTGGVRDRAAVERLLVDESQGGDHRSVLDRQRIRRAAGDDAEWFDQNSPATPSLNASPPAVERE